MKISADSELVLINVTCSEQEVMIGSGVADPSEEGSSSSLLSDSSWNRSRRSSPSVLGSSSSETIPKSNSSASQCRGASTSYAAVGSHSGVGSRLSGMESMEEAGRGGRRRRRGGGRVSEGVGVGGRRDRHCCWRIGVVSVLLALGGRRSLL